MFQKDIVLFYLVKINSGMLIHFAYVTTEVKLLSGIEKETRFTYCFKYVVNVLAIRIFNCDTFCYLKTLFVEFKRRFRTITHLQLDE